jgi:hypothetical protein
MIIFATEFHNNQFNNLSKETKETKDNRPNKGEIHLPFWKTTLSFKMSGLRYNKILN